MHSKKSLSALRRAIGLKQFELAARLGSHPSLISMWESARVTPSLKSTARLADALGVSVNEVAAAVLGSHDDAA